MRNKSFVSYLPLPKDDEPVKKGATRDESENLKNRIKRLVFGKILKNYKEGMKEQEEINFDQWLLF